MKENNKLRNHYYNNSNVCETDLCGDTFDVWHQRKFKKTKTSQTFSSATDHIQMLEVPNGGNVNRTRIKLYQLKKKKQNKIIPNFIHYTYNLWQFI